MRNWRSRLAALGVYTRSFPFKEATYVIVGHEPDGLTKGGVIAYTDNQFMAYRIRREIRKDGITDAKILPYNPFKPLEQSRADLLESVFNKAR